MTRRLALVCGVSGCGAGMAVVDGGRVLPGKNAPPIVPPPVGQSDPWVVSCGKHGPKLVTNSEIDEALGKGWTSLAVTRPAPKVWQSSLGRLHFGRSVPGRPI